VFSCAAMPISTLKVDATSINKSPRMVFGIIVLNLDNDTAGTNSLETSALSFNNNQLLNFFILGI
jgi:hypothetical protein